MNQTEQLNYKNREGLSLGDRQKQYEDVTRSYLMAKQPTIIRIDGKAFHSYVKQDCFVKSFDENIMSAFEQSTKELCENLQNVEFAYHQSDEVSIFLKDYKEEKQQQFFNGNIQKIASVVSSQFTYYFNKNITQLLGEQRKPAFFDCRVFNVPLHEVTNYFIWRQRDAIRNSINSHAGTYFSHKTLLNKNSDEKLKMLETLKETDTKVNSWENLPTSFQRGSSFYQVEIEEKIKDLSELIIKYYVNSNKEIPESIVRKKWIIDINIPIFSEQKDFIEKYVINE